MLNKKAIAALAAGATLVSGLAFAAPAMAQQPADGSGDLAGAGLLVANNNAAKVEQAKEALKQDQKTLDDAKKDLEKKQKELKTAEAEEAAKKTALDNADEAGKAAAQTAYDQAKEATKTKKTAVEEAKKAVTNAQNKVDSDNEVINAGKPSSTTPTTPTTPKNDKKIDLINLLNGGDEPSGATMVSPLGTSTLYTNYKGLTAELIKKGITNVSAYDALLDKLEFGLKQSGWANIIKNFGGDNCAYLGKLRRQLQKAVKHYGHVEAAVKDILAELNEDMKDAKAAEDFDAAKVIKGKIAQAKGLLEVAHHNRTRAEAILDSANDHARDLSCDTGAKDVLKALKGAKADKKADKKADAKKAAPLAKTGAAVALAAVAASVLAGMGAALRKIRH